MLIPPGHLIEALFTKEYPSFIHGLFPSVSERTRRNVILPSIKAFPPKTKTAPRQSTYEKIFGDISKQSGVPKESIRVICSVRENQKPWRSFWEGVKLSADSSIAKEYGYAFDVVLKIEDALFRASDAKSQGKEDWFVCFNDSELPRRILNEKFYAPYRAGKIGSNEEAGKVVRRVPVEAGRVILRIALYVLAAFERCYVATYYLEEIDLWAHKLLPTIEEERLVWPMRILFRTVFKAAGADGVREFAEAMPALTKRKQDTDPESQRRQLNRWMQGQEPPSWETIAMLRDTFFDGNDSFMIMSGVARFLQWLSNIMTQKYMFPVFFENEEEVVTIFQEYPEWQRLHAAGHSVWTGGERVASPAS